LLFWSQPLHQNGAINALRDVPPKGPTYLIPPYILIYFEFVSVRPYSIPYHLPGCEASEVALNFFKAMLFIQNQALIITGSTMNATLTSYVSGKGVNLKEVAFSATNWYTFIETTQIWFSIHYQTNIHTSSFWDWTKSMALSSAITREEAFIIRKKSPQRGDRCYK
jgi:hypothetical protein